MALDKNDLKSIGTLMDDRFDHFAIIVAKGFSSVDKRFGEVDKRFNEMDKRFDKLEAQNTKEHAQIRKDISNLEFIATEMVRRDEFLELKARLVKLEQARK